MNGNRERVAWVILLTSFFICVASAVALPVGGRRYILHSKVPQRIVLEVQQAPLRVTFAGRGAARAVDAQLEIPEGSIVATDETAGRLVMHGDGQDDIVLASVQLYDHTEVVMDTARTPRFGISGDTHRIALTMIGGRIRVNVAPDGQRETEVLVETPYGIATLTEGSYEVKINGGTSEVIARSGQAQIAHADATRDSIELAPSERVILRSDGASGPLPAARNLVVNGDFQQPLEATWTIYREQKEEPPAIVERVSDAGQSAVSFYRQGSNHAEIGIRQEIDYDVRDFAFLEMHLALKIVSEDIAGYGGCGQLSSECPLMLLLDYKDIYGTDRQWRQGFYIGEPAPDWLLYPWTQQVPVNTWQAFDSGNLVDALDENPPAVIKRLTIYASGHSFSALAGEVELLAEE